jgi:hypothetical protein
MPVMEDLPVAPAAMDPGSADFTSK